MDDPVQTPDVPQDVPVETPETPVVEAPVEEAEVSADPVQDSYHTAEGGEVQDSYLIQ